MNIISPSAVVINTMPSNALLHIPLMFGGLSFSSGFILIFAKKKIHKNINIFSHKYIARMRNYNNRFLEK